MKLWLPSFFSLILLKMNLPKYSWGFITENFEEWIFTKFNETFHGEGGEGNEDHKKATLPFSMNLGDGDSLPNTSRNGYSPSSVKPSTGKVVKTVKAVMATRSHVAVFNELWEWVDYCDSSQCFNELREWVDYCDSSEFLTFVKYARVFKFDCCS